MLGNGVPQPIGGSGNCATTTILHEMGHALGLYHEQSRADRNTYVNYMEQNIDKPNHGNFDIIGSDSVGSGLYNYASIMEYGPFTFNKDGVSPSLETIPAGMVLGTSMPQYTTGDLDGIMRLYAHAPTSITRGHESHWIAGDRGRHPLHGSVRFHHLDQRFDAHIQRPDGQSNAADARRSELYFRPVERRIGECPNRHGHERTRRWHTVASHHCTLHHQLSCQFHSRSPL